MRRIPRRAACRGGNAVCPPGAGLPCGTDLPFWLQERSRWSRVLPLLRWYERLRMWDHPQLLRSPEVMTVVQDELIQLEAALEENVYT